MIKKEVMSSSKILIKGVVVQVDEKGIHVRDTKTGIVDIVGIDLFQEFLGKDITMTIGDKLTSTEILTSEEDIEEYDTINDDELPFGNE